MKFNLVGYSDDKWALIFLSSAKSKEPARVTDVKANRGEFSTKSVHGIVEFEKCSIKYTTLQRLFSFSNLMRKKIIWSLPNKQHSLTICKHLWCKSECVSRFIKSTEGRLVELLVCVQHWSYAQICLACNKGHTSITAFHVAHIDVTCSGHSDSDAIDDFLPVCILSSLSCSS